MSLLLTRRVGESIVIDGDITVTVIGVKGQIVRLKIDAPPEVEIWRTELTEEVP